MKNYLVLLVLLSTAYVAAQKAIVATGPFNQYVWVNNTAHCFVAQNVPSEMEAKLEYFIKTKKQTVTAVGFTPAKGWTILTTKGYWARNIDGDYFDEIKKVYNKGDYVTDVAFNPAHWEKLRGFAFVTSKGEVESKYVGGSRMNREHWLSYGNK